MRKASEKGKKLVSLEDKKELEQLLTSLIDVADKKGKQLDVGGLYTDENNEKFIELVFI